MVDTREIHQGPLLKRIATLEAKLNVALQKVRAAEHYFDVCEIADKDYRGFRQNPMDEWWDTLIAQEASQ